MATKPCEKMAPRRASQGRMPKGICGGGLFYSPAFINYLKSMKYLLWFMYALAGLLGVFIVVTETAIWQSSNYETVKPTFSYPSPTPIGIKLSPTKTPYIQTAIQPTVDPDPIITCIFDHVPSQAMRKSECDRSFECEIDQWRIYFDKNKCIEDQQNYFSNETPPSYVYQPAPVYVEIDNTMQKYNEERQRIFDELNRQRQEINNRTYESSLDVPTYVAPTMMQIQEIKPTCQLLGNGDYSLCDGMAVEN